MTMFMENFGVINKEYYGMLWYFLEWSIRNLKNEKGPGAELCPAIDFGIVTGDAPVSYWSPETFPEVFAKVNSTQSLSRF